MGFRRPYWYLAIGLSSFLVLVSVYRLRNRNEKNVQERSDRDSKFEALEREVRALRQTVHANAVRSNHVDMAGNPATDRTPGPGAGASDDLMPVRHSEDADQHSASVSRDAEFALAQGGVDPDWSMTRQEELKQAVETVKLEGFSFRSAQCSKTICRILVGRSADASTVDFGPAIVAREPFRSMGVFFRYDDEQVVMYAVREGHPFPSSQQESNTQ